MQPSLESQPSSPGSVAHILHLEDSEPDRELVRLLLKDASIDCEITAVETEGDFVRSLNQESWDLILSDFSLPSFDGIRALAIAAKICPSTPFIFVTGTIGEDIAVESLKSGATDYVLKQRMTRLVGVGAARPEYERAEKAPARKGRSGPEKERRTTYPSGISRPAYGFTESSASPGSIDTSPFRRQTARRKGSDPLRRSGSVQVCQRLSWPFGWRPGLETGGGAA